MPKLKMKPTERGFMRGNFIDDYKQKCSLQKSSAACYDAIWLGVDNTGPHLQGPNGKNNEDVHMRMHLTQKQVKDLLPLLTKFAKTGELY